MVKVRMRILIVGGGYVGLYTALRLQRQLKRELSSGDIEIVDLDAETARLVSTSTERK